MVLPAMKPVDVKIVLEKKEDELCCEWPCRDQSHSRDRREEGNMLEHPRNKQRQHIALHDSIQGEIVEELWSKEALTFRVWTPTLEQYDCDRTEHNRGC